MREAVRIITTLGAMAAVFGAGMLAGFPGALLVFGAAVFFSGCVDILKESK